MATLSVSPAGNGGFLLPAGYLSTQGSQIVDSSGNPVRIASVGWNQGFDNIPASIAAIKAAGFNCVRVSWVDANIGSDLARIDQVVAAASAAGVKVILDHHTNEAGTPADGYGAQQSNGLPYDVGGASNGTNGAGVQGTVTLQQYQDHWVSIAQRYAGNPTVAGFDLTNEPLAYGGMSTWGTGNPNTDLQMIYSKVGSAIQAVNSGPLIICEGPQNYNMNFAGTAPAPWGDLSLAGKNPVTLTVGNKVVYSVHDYPAPIAGFQTDSGNQAVDYMNKTWGYLQAQNIAPVWIGEMGGSLDGTADSAGGNLAVEQAWAKTLLDYMNGKYAAQGGPSVTGNQQGMSGDWWAWGNLAGQYPDGTVNGDGSLKSGQKAFWSQMLFTTPTGNITPTPPVTPKPTPSPDNTLVLNTTSKIVDANGNSWTITAGKQVAVNGVTDTNTANVIELAWEKGVVWHENTSMQWYGKKLPTDGWGAATTTSPVPTVTPTPPVTPKPTASPDNTLVTTTTGKIVDASGNVWTITAGKQVAVNGVTDTNTANVIELAWEKGVVWHENTSLQWYGKKLPTDGWGAATTTSPVPTPPPTKPPVSPDNTLVMNTTGKIVDASGNAWTITAGKQVAVNGVTDTNTANVIELAWEKGVVWHENTSLQWYGKKLPTDGWGTATTTSPVPTPPPTKPPVSPDNTLVMNTTGKIVDASGNTWTITAGGQVAVNGIADTTTANVTELAYEKGVVWQENNSALWWSKTLPTDAWGPDVGTATSPVPVTPTQGGTTQTATGTVVGSGSDTIVLTMSEDADGPAGAAGRDAQFTVNVDGKQIGGLQTVTASRAAGQSQVFSFKGNYAPGAHNVVVTFANNSGTTGDKAAFNDGGDRNLYVNSISYDGALVKGTTTGIYTSPLFPPEGTYDPGAATFAVTDTTSVPANAPSTPTTTPAAVNVGTGADTLVLRMAEDPYQGDAQFTVAVDGKQVGGTLSTTAIAWQGQAQEFDLHGTWGTGTHTVAVAFVNDATGPLDPSGLAYDGTDRNLYIKGVAYNGAAASGTPWELSSNGSHSFSVTGAAAVVKAASVVTSAAPAASSVTLVPATGTPHVFDGNTTASLSLRTDTFSMLGGGVAKIAMGSVSDSLKFIGMSSVTLTNGRGNVSVASDGGSNTFIAGKGALAVTGGAGADAYIVAAGSGALTVNDFSLAKGDTLTLGANLKTAMQIGSDGHGGTAISFGAGTGTIDLKSVASLPTTAIHFA